VAVVITLIVLAVIAVVLVAWVIGMYNGLARARIRVKEAWSGIDVQLKRRSSLIPNLVETVKGYAAHEKETLENVTRARAMLDRAATPGQAAQADNMLTSALRSLFAVSEAYPDLKANQNFQELQRSLETLEAGIQNARRYYNAVVRDLNTKIQSVPSVFVARLFGFEEREFFELADAAEAQVPSVKF
jgi:LemA protein